MKRCPQCEFIYEDDQSLCDMDGVLLVFDSRTLPNSHALAKVPASKAAPRRNRAVPAFATVILALVLGMVYYVSMQRHARQSTIEIPAASAATTSNSAPEVNPTPQAQPPEAVQAPIAEELPPAPAKQPAVTPVKKSLPAKAAPETTTKTSTEPKKEENKVGSILKKTGRILKKPF